MLPQNISIKRRTIMLIATKILSNRKGELTVTNDTKN